jgi:hypothetical protein
MTICNNCATNKGLIPKDKQIAVWMGKCPYCGLNAFLADENHDYKSIPEIIGRCNGK